MDAAVPFREGCPSASRAAWRRAPRHKHRPVGRLDQWGRKSVALDNLRSAVRRDRRCPLGAFGPRWTNRCVEGRL